MRWSLHFTGGPRCSQHAAAIVGHNIYTFGGYCPEDSQSVSAPIEVHCFNTFFYRWKQLFTQDEYCGLEYFQKCTHSIPFNRYGHTVVNYKDGIYLWGGRNDIDKPCNKLFCYHANPRRYIDNYWSVVEVYGTVPDSRDGHAACVHQDSMYIFGGYSEEKDEHSDSLWQLNFLSSSWSRVAAGGDIPFRRDRHTLTSHGDKLYVFGGQILPHMDIIHSFYDNTVHCFDIKNKQWNQVAETSEVKPSGRQIHSAFVYKNGLYIFGGFNERGLNSVYRLDLIENQWSEMAVKGAYPCPRQGQVCVMCSDRMFLFGGATPVATVPHGQSLSFVQEDHNLNYDEQGQLVGLNGMHILDFKPIASLRNIAMRAVINYHIDFSDNDLPWDVIQDIGAIRPSKVN